MSKISLILNSFFFLYHCIYILLLSYINIIRLNKYNMLIQSNSNIIQSNKDKLIRIMSEIVDNNSLTSLKMNRTTRNIHHPSYIASSNLNLRNKSRENSIFCASTTSTTVASEMQHPTMIPCIVKHILEIREHTIFFSAIIFLRSKSK